MHNYYASYEEVNQIHASPPKRAYDAKGRGRGLSLEGGGKEQSRSGGGYSVLHLPLDWIPSISLVRNAFQEVPSLLPRFGLALWLAFTVATGQ
jgi:hypothetical protein